MTGRFLIAITTDKNDAPSYFDNVYEDEWIEEAGHNSNTDKPEMINNLIEEFLSNIL